MQYAPVATLLLGIVFVRTPLKLLLATAAALQTGDAVVLHQVLEDHVVVSG